MSAALASVEDGTTRAESPYQGLTPFSEADAPFFFGRDEWREIIVDNLKAHRLTLLYGESGVGKTSVLRAGVEHDLRERARLNLAEDGTPDLAIAAFSSWHDAPLSGLIRCIRGAVADALGEEPVEPAEPLDLEATLEDCARRVGGKLFVILDQFEEYFLYHAVHDGEGSFAEAFPHAVARRDLRASFLVSIREDALAKLDRFKRQIPNLFDNALRIERLDRVEGREAVMGPLGEYNRRAEPAQRVDIAPDLIEPLLDQVEAGKVVVGQTGAGVVEETLGSREARIETPYLQLVLTRLWDEEHRAGSRLLQLKTFENLGGAKGIVHTHLDGAMSALPTPEQEVAARLFHHLVTPSGTKIAQGLRDLVTYAERPEAQTTSILERLSGDVRILRPVGDSSYEIYHDALAGPILDWRARWQERKNRRRERRRALVLGVAAIGASVIAVAFVLLTLQARHQKELARSRELAARAMAQLPIDPQRSLQLAVDAAGVSETAQAEDALRAALGQSHVRAVLRGHKDPVYDAAFSRDGTLIVTAGGSDGTARVWRTAGGRAVAVLRGAGFQLNSAAFSPDGRHVVTAEDDGVARVWDTTGGRPVARLRGRCRDEACLPVTGATFSPDGKLVLVISDFAFLYRAESASLLHVLKGTAAVDRAAFSPDGRLIVTAFADGTARVWDRTSGKKMAALRRHSGRILAVAFSHNGKLVVTASADGTARVSQAATGRTVVTYLAHTGPVQSAAFSPGGRLVVTAGDDGTPRVWQSGTGRTTAILRGHTGPVRRAAFSPDGRLVVTASDDGTARVWQAATSESLAILRGHTGSVCCAAFSSDGRLVVTAGSDATARVWQVASVQPVAVLRGHAREVTGAAFSPDGREVATASLDGTARVWNAKTGQSAVVVRGRVALLGASFSPDGELLLTPGEDGAASVWDWKRHRRIAVLRGRGGPVRSAAFSRDGAFVVTAAPGLVRVWEWAAARTLAILPAANGNFTRFEFTAAAFSPNGKSVVTADKSLVRENPAHQARVWAWLPLRGLDLGEAEGVAGFQRRHKLFVDGIVGPQTLAALNSNALTGHTKAVNSAVFSPDGRRVITASSDLTAQVWTLAQKEDVIPLRGHTAPVRSAAFSPDGKLVITASDDGTARIWQAATGQPLEVLRGHTGRVSSAVFSPKGRLIATAGADSTARIYTCELCGSIDHLLALAKARLQAN